MLSLSVLLIAVSAAPAAAPSPAGPIISEVLFHVPKEHGDANGDGTRHAIGDEFVELHNPTRKPINLKGYQLLNRLTAEDSETSLGVRFEFPDFTLGPGQTVVVFNGFESSVSGPAGDASRAPSATNPAFADAWVFTINPESRYNAFANAGDAAILREPGGRFIEVVSWGKPEPAPPASASTNEVAKEPDGSVARADAAGGFKPHREVDSAKRCSPGSVPWATPTKVRRPPR